jgi:hypothetical protein
VKRVDEVQTDLVSYLKTLTAVTAIVSADEIREESWKGTEFAYPNIRVGMRSLLPDDACQKSEFTVSLLCYTENDSSRICNQIAGLLAGYFINVSRTISGTQYVGMKSSNVIPAIPAERNTWRAEVTIVGQVAG